MAVVHTGTAKLGASRGDRGEYHSAGTSHRSGTQITRQAGKDGRQVRRWRRQVRLHQDGRTATGKNCRRSWDARREDPANLPHGHLTAWKSLAPPRPSSWRRTAI